MKIGVFDSGVGGASVANAIQEALPEYEVLVCEDKENLPYGTKTSEQLLALVTPILQEMVDAGCSAIVVACNTVTTNIIDDLRGRVAVPLIGMEPMVKPAAAQTKTGVIAVCATPATLRSERYAWLKGAYAGGVTVLEPDCGDWASMIEHKQIDEQKIRQRIEVVIAQGADIVVLGCTHYHWIEKEIIAATNGQARVLQPEQPVITRLKRALLQLA